MLYFKAVWAHCVRSAISTLVPVLAYNAVWFPVRRLHSSAPSPPNPEHHAVPTFERTYSHVLLWPGESLWHRGLIAKLGPYGIGGGLLCFFESYLTGRGYRLYASATPSRLPSQLIRVCHRGQSWGHYSFQFTSMIYRCLSPMFHCSPMTPQFPLQVVAANC